MTPPAAHEPVLLEETLELLAPASGDVVVDGTLGAGGHSAALLERILPGGRLLAIDRDTAAIELARRRLARYAPAWTVVHGDHRDLLEIVADTGIEQVDRILLDLGVSSMQIDDPRRGFSFAHDGPLDMRMDPTSGETAAELLARSSEEELRQILWRYGEERHARAIVRAIVADREKEPFLTTRPLAALIERVLYRPGPRPRIHPATRTFQALRVAVNGEIEGLETLVDQAVSLLRSGGRIAVISFHSLEDRAIKRAFRDLAGRCTCPPRLPVCACGKQDVVRVLTSKPVRATEAEIERNPRSRSARLRAAEKR